MDFKLPDLPYEQHHLEPHISRRTVHHHYEKHHHGYLKKLEKALDERAERLPLEQIIENAYEDGDQGLFNLSAQVWNHNFYWQSLTPEPVALTDDVLERHLARAFGSVDAFKKKFKTTASEEFGSGWAWLAYDRNDDVVKVLSTTDAVNPLPLGLTPLLTLDVWEHAYYLDFQQKRGDYIDAFLDKLINWEFAAANLSDATAQKKRAAAG